MHGILNGRHLLGHGQSSDPHLPVLVELLCKLQAGGCDQLVSKCKRYQSEQRAELAMQHTVFACVKSKTT